MTVTSPQRLSVILSTYNAPGWLEKSLWGYACQRLMPFEVIIADDGSDRRTSDVIQQIRDRTSLNLKHVWHPDDGFRKCTIMNRAIEKAEGDYLVFSDGDCIPRADFLQHHQRCARPGHFLSGGYYKLPMSLSEAIGQEEIVSGKAFSLGWLRRHGLPVSHRMVRLATRGPFAALGNSLTTTRPTWNGHNASGWTDDLIRVNGFDERMRYGGEDRELGERLVNLGIKPVQIRFHAICLHLDHSRGYVSDVDLENNRKIREVTRQLRRTETQFGIRHLAEAA